MHIFCADVHHYRKTVWLIPSDVIKVARIPGAGGLVGTARAMSDFVFLCRAINLAEE